MKKPKKAETILIPLPRALPGTLLSGLIEVFNAHSYDASVALRPRGRGHGMTLECRLRPSILDREKA